MELQEMKDKFAGKRVQFVGMMGKTDVIPGHAFYLVLVRSDGYRSPNTASKSGG